MSEGPKPISDAELDLLKVLWRLGPSTVRQVLDGLAPGSRSWAYTTVQTLLTRLVQKGYITASRDGRAHIFAAAVKREDLLGRELREIADRVCDGEATPLVLALVGKNRFSKEDLKQFRELLDRLGRPDQGNAGKGMG